MRRPRAASIDSTCGYAADLGLGRGCVTSASFFGLCDLAPESGTSLDRGRELSRADLCRQVLVVPRVSERNQLTPLLCCRVAEVIEVVDGFKRVRAARQPGWAQLRVELREADRAEAKLLMFWSHRAEGLSDLEEAWVVRSLYREDGLSQPEIARLLGRDKSWACRRLQLAEGLRPAWKGTPPEFCVPRPLGSVNQLPGQVAASPPPRPNRVVPLAMEDVGREVDGSELFV